MKKWVSSFLFMLVLAIVILLPKNDAYAATSGNCGSGVDWSFAGDTLSISGSGAMNDYPVYDTPGSPQCMPWYEVKDSIRNVNIGEGVTKVGSCSFYGLGNIQNVSLPSTLQEIGFGAFADCKGIGEITIPAGKIGESAFIRCSGLTKVTIGSGVTASGVSAFENCTSLQGVYISDVAKWCAIDFGGLKANPVDEAQHLYLNGTLVTNLEIPDGVTAIRDYAFWYCSDLQTVKIPASVKTIGEYAFYYDKALTTVTMSEGLESIGASAFDSTGVTTVNIPSTVKNIGSYGFAYAPLNVVKISKGTIGNNAFISCGVLYDITIGAGVTMIGDNAFAGCNALPTGMGTVTYTGTSAQWDALNKTTGNDLLWSKAINFTGAESADSPVSLVKPTYTFGSYPQGAGGEVQPIEWYVLEDLGSRKLLVSKNILKFDRYYSNIQRNVTWADSSLRTWLNTEFKNAAFTADEKNKIEFSSITNESNPTYGTNGGSATKDEVFVLSASEIEKYFPIDESKAAACSEYALASGGGDPALREPTRKTTYYWVRTPGINGYSAMYTHYTGSLRYDGMAVANTITGVRPAIWINTDGADKGGDPEKIGGFVTRLYNVCLKRDPDEGGKTDWVNRLASGSETGTMVAYGFAFSDEFKNYNYCNSDFVKLLYNAFMGREYDDDGLAYWVNKLQSGMTREEVFNGFAQSQEFKNICAEYGITVGESVGIPEYGTVPTGPCSVCNTLDGVTAFTARLYQVCLDRDPDTVGLTDWCDKLRKHEKSGRDVSFGFIFSTEFQNRGFDDNTFVDYMYKALFDRPADNDGKADWMNRINNEGYTREQVFDGFMGSEEFNNLCKRYGIVRE